MTLFSWRRSQRRDPDGAEALLAMTPRQLADLPFWVEPPQPDCAEDELARRPVTPRTAPRRLPA
ncbi:MULTISPECIES: hypothetical protein [unclassified Inquilinus]|uniref:hypothetical protein n=1 Tax=unclassified Inquilinus TaxID=2645927 RepID=UPI003F8DDB77